MTCAGWCRGGALGRAPIRSRLQARDRGCSECARWGAYRPISYSQGGGVDAKLVGEVLADTAVFLPFVAQPLRQRIEVGCLHVMVGSWLELV